MIVRSTFAMPALIAATSLIGLLSALTGDGVRDAVSWAALSMPVIGVGWAMWRASHRSTPRHLTKD